MERGACDGEMSRQVISFYPKHLLTNVSASVIKEGGVLEMLHLNREEGSSPL